MLVVTAADGDECFGDLIGDLIGVLATSGRYQVADRSAQGGELVLDHRGQWWRNGCFGVDLGYESSMVCVAGLRVVITKYSGTRQPDPPRYDRQRPQSHDPVPGSEPAPPEYRLRGHVSAALPGRTTPTEEILAGFDDLIGSGKILHGGLSNFPAWRVAGAAVRADLRRLPPLVGIESEYSLAERSAERELLPMAQAYGLGVLTYSPLAGGLLTGKYRQGQRGRLSARSDVIEGTEQRGAVVDAVLAIADEIGTSPIRFP